MDTPHLNNQPVTLQVHGHMLSSYRRSHIKKSHPARLQVSMLHSVSHVVHVLLLLCCQVRSCAFVIVWG